MATTDNYSICTLASHSALQILKGAHDEGLHSIAICERRHLKTYESFRVADEIIPVDEFAELPGLDEQLAGKNAILIPHGSLVNALGFEQIKKLRVNYYGNKQALAWESDRRRQRQWLQDAGLTVPR